MSRKALIIEDDEFMITNLVELLELEDFVVQSTSDGRQALELARSFLPDIILSDMRLPGMDGLAILSGIRQDDQTSHIPFVFLTGRTESTQVKTALSAGADGYLVKPFEVMDLLRVIENLMGNHV